MTDEELRAIKERNAERMQWPAPGEPFREARDDVGALIAEVDRLRAALAAATSEREAMGRKLASVAKFNLAERAGLCSRCLCCARILIVADDDSEYTALGRCAGDCDEHGAHTP